MSQTHDPGPGHEHRHGHPRPSDHPHGHDHPGAPASSRGPLADASVRRARVNDAPAVGMVQAGVFRDTYSGRVPDEVVGMFAPEEFARAWRAGLENPPAGVHTLLVACAGDQVVGAAAIGPAQDPDAGPATGEVTLLAVHPDARRAGHGSRLLNACVDLLREAGADEAVLWLLADDEPTRAFLVASGFGPDGAFRDRVVSPDGDTLREVRLAVTLTPTDG